MVIQISTIYQNIIKVYENINSYHINQYEFHCLLEYSRNPYIRNTVADPHYSRLVLGFECYVDVEVVCFYPLVHVMLAFRVIG